MKKSRKALLISTVAILGLAPAATLAVTSTANAAVQQPSAQKAPGQSQPAKKVTPTAPKAPAKAATQAPAKKVTTPAPKAPAKAVTPAPAKKVTTPAPKAPAQPAKAATQTPAKQQAAAPAPQQNQGQPNNNQSSPKTGLAR